MKLFVKLQSMKRTKAEGGASAFEEAIMFFNEACRL
jgi:hypothetical protein